MRSSVVLLTFFICGFLYANDGNAQKPRLAVFPMSDVGAETEVRSHIVGSNQFLVEPADTTIEVVQGGKELGITCKATDTSCLVELGRLGDLAYLFVASSRGSKMSFNLITISDGRVKRGKTIDLKSKTRGEDLRVAVLELVHPDGLLAKVSINTGDVAADVYINGQAVGTTPLPQALFLEAGEHELSLKADGHQPYARKVIVKHGQLVNLDIGLIPSGAVAGADAGATEPDEESSTLVNVFSHPLAITGLAVGGMAFALGTLVGIGVGGFSMLLFELPIHNLYGGETDINRLPADDRLAVEKLREGARVPEAIALAGIGVAFAGLFVVGAALGTTFVIVE